MKKFAFLYLLCFILTVQSFATVATGYTFIQTSGTYSNIGGGTILGNTSNDDEIFLTDVTGSASNQTAAGFAIGFTFTYDGAIYTQFGVSNNGYIKLGNLPSFSMNCNGYYGDMASTGDGLLIGGFVNDLQGQPGSKLEYLLSGSSPNRVLTIQWKKYQQYGTNGDDINFQISLYETSNVVKITYGNFNFGTGQQGHEVTSMVGLFGTTNSDYFLRSSNWATSTNGTFNSDNIPYNGSSMPANGLTFTYTPISALPVELISFEVDVNSSLPVASWSLASETNNDYFLLERSNDAVNYKKVKTVKGAGNSSFITSYSTIDSETVKITTYYRLSQYDFDGAHRTLAVRSVNSPNINRIFKVYPNPATTDIVVEVNALAKNIQVYLIDYEDRSILLKEFKGDTIERYTFILPLPVDRGFGSYIITILLDGKAYSQQILIQ